jgi:hypothetical protein
MLASAASIFSGILTSLGTMPEESHEKLWTARKLLSLVDKGRVQFCTALVPTTNKELSRTKNGFFRSKSHKKQSFQSEMLLFLTICLMLWRIVSLKPFKPVNMMSTLLFPHDQRLIAILNSRQLRRYSLAADLYLEPALRSALIARPN